METWATHAGQCLETVSRLGGESRGGEHEVRCAWIRRTRRFTTATPLNTHTNLLLGHAVGVRVVCVGVSMRSEVFHTDQAHDAYH